MTLGTLRDQIIYPHTKAEMKRRGNVNDEDLKKFLDLVHLTHLLDRENFSNSEGQGWDAVADWMDVLSGGEKQRIAVSLSELFSHLVRTISLLLLVPVTFVVNYFCL